ncbi:MAG TPA: hypothetical protein VFC63_24425 [Blastocatellia bacterium]|nr:hypothetical protein [Blastocatellia bacterium]
MNPIPNMLSIIQMTKPHGQVPNGMKVASINGPNSLQPLPKCPAVAVGSFTLWPMSYIDNRVSFGMVMYDPKWNVVTSAEKPGARYIYKIEKDAAGNVTFHGQADQKVTMSLDEICKMLCHP